MKLNFAALILVGVIGASWLPSQAAAFVPFKGTYNGLFYEQDWSWEQSAGLISISTTAKGSYSGKVKVGPCSYSFSGWFAADGSASKTILRRFDYPIRLQFQVDAQDSDLIEGSVSSGDWSATFYADRAVFNAKTAASPDAGQYTLLFPGNYTNSDSPGGDGYATITVTTRGQVRMGGALADGTKISQSSYISKNGLWPFFQSLYSGNGAIYSWVAFNSSPTNSAVQGDVIWFRNHMPWTWYYPEGFAIEFTAWGSHYVRPAKNAPILNLTRAEVEFNGTCLAYGFTNSITLDLRNHITNLEPNGLKMSFNTSNGHFSGKVVDPYTWTWRSFNGVVLQDYNCAGGYFLGWNQSGEIWLEEPQTSN